ncbi:MAG: RpiB/LacA/LacB family sugar-phosphate isomerase [Candidatus Doudnabacteria bacterium]|nr:RpiB/LacA/LacB family sugar-phosphate isomerase [Candidatus Doudnabacteria bacterium]
MIYIASDHAGFELKNQLVDYLKSKDLEVEDCGPYEFNEADDYPDFIHPCVLKVAAGLKQHKGIVIGFSGQGEAMVANKVKGIRAAVYYGGNKEIASLARRHNDANVLSLGAGFLSVDAAKEAVDVWLATEFEGGRHQRRIDKIEHH